MGSLPGAVQISGAVHFNMTLHNLSRHHIPPSSSSSERHHFAAVAALFFINTIGCAAQTLTAHFYDKTPYHTSALTGCAWVQELITGHPNRIKSKLGMTSFKCSLKLFIASDYKIQGILLWKNILQFSSIPVLSWTCHLLIVYG